jgi:hypothetical protein
LYRVEIVVNGQKQIYIGSASDLKERLMGPHKWKKYIHAKQSKIQIKTIYGEPNVRASGRQTHASAQQEALRSMEQEELEIARREVEAENKNLPKGRKPTKILNEIDAASDPHSWQQRHNTSRSRDWKTIKEPGGQLRMPKALLTGMVALTVLDAYVMAQEWRDDEWRRQYEWAPYVLEDEGGVFILEEGEWLFSKYYYKTYVDESGELTEENRVEIDAKEFNELKSEAEALWGTFEENEDGEKEFVPGLLNPELREKKPQG